MFSHQRQGGQNSNDDLVDLSALPAEDPGQSSDMHGGFAKSGVVRPPSNLGGPPGVSGGMGMMLGLKGSGVRPSNNVGFRL